MSEAIIQKGEVTWNTAEQHFCIDGDLTLATVVDVMAQAEPLFVNAAEMVVDLANVTRSDSAGLAILIEWMRVVAAANKKISFQNVPKQMMGIAGTTGLDKILPLKK